jgi:hypothetical protein
VAKTLSAGEVLLVVLVTAAAVALLTAARGNHVPLSPVSTRLVGVVPTYDLTGGVVRKVKFLDRIKQRLKVLKSRRQVQLQSVAVQTHILYLYLIRSGKALDIRSV